MLVTLYPLKRMKSLRERIKSEEKEGQGGSPGGQQHLESV